MPREQVISTFLSHPIKPTQSSGLASPAKTKKVSILVCFCKLKA